MKRVDRPNRQTIILELLFWLPLALLPYGIRLVSGQQTHQAEPWLSLFVPLVLAFLIARMGRFETAARAVTLIVLWLGGLFAIGLALAGLGVAEPQTVLAALDTNPSEAREFLAHFYSRADVTVIALLLIPVMAFWIQWRRRAFWRPGPGTFKWLVAMLVVQIVAFGGWASLVNRDARHAGVGSELVGQIYPIGWYPPLKPYVQVLQAWRLRRMMLRVAEEPAVSLTNVVDLSPDARPRTLVVVLTESVARAHMSLYGYGRDTTPRLDALKAGRELVVFSDAITSHAQTGAALVDALTWNDPASPQPRSIIDVFNAAGFETHWLSNQPGLGVFDNFAAVLTRRATHRTWLAHPAMPPRADETGASPQLFHAPERSLNERLRDNFDDRVIPALTTILQGPTRNRVVFVHLMGSHSIYRARYPPSAEYFSDTAHSGLTPAQADVVNSYDNSIRFGDAVVADIIGTVRAAGGVSAVLYVSDHGQEVYRFRDLAGHANVVLSPWMTDIPLLVWMSPEYWAAETTFANEVVSAAEHPYVHHYLPASLAALGRLAHPHLPASDNLFSAAFVARPRTTAALDYETFRRTWANDAAHAKGIALLPGR